MSNSIPQSKNIVLLAEDDDDHYFLIQNAFRGIDAQVELYRVTNGVELIEYLLHEGKFKEESAYPKPIMVLLDLNLPKKDGRQVLKEIVTYPHLKKIPIAILTTSINEEDIVNSYNLGAKFFIKKPVLFKEYVDIIKKLQQCWLDFVSLSTEI